ncbi:uncharacterized protein EI97DRAFT_434795, partial [Westerdykella ornata]
MQKTRREAETLSELPPHASPPQPSLPPRPFPPPTDSTDSTAPPPPSNQANPPIFHNLTFYLNGSTAPYISDHKLRHLIASHAGSLSLSLARRSVTHVILSPSAASASASSSSSSSSSGCGGALAASKIQREIARRGGGGKGVKFVSVEWVLECVRRGRRVAEGRYQVLGLGGGGQGSVVQDFFGRKV